MTYQEAVKYLFTATPVFQNTGATAYKEGLDNILTLDQHFASPHESYKTIHVGGTNGKGSTSHSLSAILQAEGYKVGLFTSPHLLDFRERIRVNGEMISEDRVTSFVQEIQELVEHIRPSFFELTTALALLYFKEQKVDFAIIEVGLGGRLDSTNIIHPILSIITNISIDHTQFLGKSLTSIAQEKAGIIKSSTPVIIGEKQRETETIFKTIAQERQSPIFFAEESYPLQAKACPKGGQIYQSAKLGTFKGELGADIQIRNSQTILSAIECLRQQEIQISDEAIIKGMASVCQMTGLLGRWQVIQEKPFPIICDTAHNEAGFQAVIHQFQSLNYKKLRIIIGFAQDKAIDSILRLLPKEASYYLTQAQGDRALKVAELHKQVEALGIQNQEFPSVEEAISQALEDSQEGDSLFIGGSNFIVAEALTYFKSIKSNK